MAKSHPPPFLTKTYQLVDGTEYDDVISWNETGSAFVVWDAPQFSSLVLPKFFKHNNFSSFVRQLNTYGFRKTMSERWEFGHDLFKKGEKERLCEIRRNKNRVSNVAVALKVSPPASAEFLRMLSPSVSDEEQVISADSRTSAQEFSGGGSDLIVENQRLREENVRLDKELGEMKNLCKNIYLLMSRYGSQESDSVENAMTVLNLLPVPKHGGDMEVDGVEKGVGGSSSIKLAAGEICEELFGVPVGVKRARTCEDLELEEPRDEKSDNGQGSSSET